MLFNIFNEILKMSISAGIIAIIVILLRLIMKNRINKTLILLFWAVVFIKLALPFELPFPTSVFNALPNINIINIQTLNKDSNTSLVSNTNINNTVSTTEGSKINNSDATAIPVTTPLKGVSFAEVVILIWVCGVSLLFLFFICIYIAIHLRFKEAIMIKNDFVEEFIVGYNLKHKVRVLKSSYVKTPVVFGVFRPKIILPMDFDAEDEKTLKHILTHEMEHIIRLDNLTNICVLLLLCLHWFNPVVWLSKVLLSKDIEAACDEGAICRLGEQHKCEYAESLLRMAQHSRRLSPALFVSFGESEVESRIKAILKYKRIKVASTILAVILLCGVCLLFATNMLPKVSAKPILSDSSKTMQNNNEFSYNSSSIPVQQTDDIFMKYVNDHGYKVQPNSESGGKVQLINFYNVKSNDKINVVLNNAYESSKKLGFDLLPYQSDIVIFHTCGIDFVNGKSAEANCFTYNNKIIGFWIFTPPDNGDKEDFDSYYIQKLSVGY